MMKRRDLSTLLALTPVAGLAFGQGEPVEGKQYLKLAQQQPQATDKIEVIEFFRYTCPHCHALDPVVEVWLKDRPADVSFRRVPVGSSLVDKLLARSYFALDAMGVGDFAHVALFKALHQDKVELQDEKAVTALVQRNGVDAEKFRQAFNSFSMQTKVQQANKLAEAYGIDFVPALAVGGRWRTSPDMAGGPGAAPPAQRQQALAVTNFLINRVRNKT